MNEFLNNYITSVSANEARKIHDVLRESRVNVGQYDGLSNFLRNSNNITNTLMLQAIRPMTMMQSEGVYSSFDQFDERINAVFNVSNNIALLLSSYTQSLISDIASVESELNDLEKAIGNYAFLLSDAKAHDYAFLEPFSDLLNQELIDQFFSDRDKDAFTEEQTVSVDTQEGSISISNNLNTTYSLSAYVLKDNYSPHIRSDSGIENATKQTSTNGWRTSIAAPSPIRAVLPEFENLYRVPPSEYVGPLAIAEFNLDSPATCDTIKIVPFSEFEIEITQIVLYHGSEGKEERHMLDAPVLVDSAINLFFPMTSVSKFRVYLRQPLYTRLFPNSNRSNEDKHRESIAAIVKHNQDKSKVIETLLSDFLDRAKRAGTNNIPTDIPLKDVRLTDFASFEQLLMDLRYQKPRTSVERIDSDTPVIVDDPMPSIYYAIQSISNSMRSQLLSQNYFVLGSTRSQAEKSTDPEPIDTNEPVEDTTADPLLYQYNMGLQQVTIGSGTQGFKGVFVSKILDAPSDLTDVKIKVSDFNYKLPTDTNELQPVTSVEYSVTNVSNPHNESDWIPILPSNESTVVGERLLLDSLGKAMLRFSASFNAPITVFKNNEILRLTSSDYITSPSGQEVQGIRIPGLVNSGTDIFTCNYTPAYDETMVSFFRNQDALTALAAASGPDGLGEVVSNSFGQLSVTLSKAPYVDASKLNPVLDPVLGLVDYQPITVRFNDGTIARNFTNYGDGEDLVLDPSSEEYQFIHRGNTLLFNKPLVQSFRAYYKYIPCNVRFRVVLRCNYQTFISPKVDYVHLKAKTRSLV